MTSPSGHGHTEQPLSSDSRSPERQSPLFSRCLGLLLLLGVPGVARAQTVPIQVDVSAHRHAISPFIYGVAGATPAALTELNSPLNRNGGNAASRYNWQANAANRARDYYFESLPYSGTEPGAELDTFISNARGAGAEASVTVPTMGWVARLGLLRTGLASFSILKYGLQTGLDLQYFSDAGNGILNNGRYVLNDPTDANVAVDSSFQKGWVQHLKDRWGQASQGGVRFFAMDNEPGLWHETHRDIHPAGATLQEMLDKHVTYGAMVKDTVPGALVLGPEEWGWSGYFYSGADVQTLGQTGYSSHPDRDAHGGWDALPWLLDQMRRKEQLTGRRLLDVLTVHYYPQGGEFSSDTSPSTQLRRNRSTRSLWDPTYTDESWINDKVMLVPRLKQWVAQYYPGTQTGITEYNWGAEEHINGATAQADILGIFGREGLDYANRWQTPAATTPTYKAMKLYRNYDGHKSTFGDVSVACSVPNPDLLSAFAAQRTSDGALTLMVINKAAQDAPVVLSLAGFSPAGAVQRWQLTSANVLSRLSDLALPGGSALNTVVPGQSVTLFVLAPAPLIVNQPPTAVLQATPTSGSAPLTPSFNALGSTDPDGSIVAYAWDFGDGQQGSGPLVSHVYSQPGSYTARLTVTDNGGASSSTPVTVSVAAGVPPTASPPATSLTAPSNFYSYSTGSQVVLNWTDNCVGEDGFILERSPDTWPQTFGEVGRVGANVNTAVDTPPAPGSYVYRVRAYQGSLSSAASNQDGSRVQ